MRVPLVMVAVGIVLAGCTDPSTPIPTPEPTTDAPVTTMWAPCDDATTAALSASLEGQLLLAPDDSLAGQEFENAVTYPAFLPAPSCIAYPTGQALTVAYFIGATEADVAAFEETIVEWEGDSPTPVDGIEPPVIVAETWPMGPVIDLRLFAASNGISQPYLQVTSVFSATGEGG